MPLPVFPPGVKARGKISVAFVFAVANVNSPTLAEVTAAGGITLSCYLTDFNVTNSQNKGSDTRLCSDQQYEEFGDSTFSIDDLVYIIDPQDTTTTTAKGKLAPGANGFLIPRYGFAARTVDWAATQIVDVLPVKLGDRVKSKTSSDEFGKFAYTQHVAVTGPCAFDVPIAA